LAGPACLQRRFHVDESAVRGDVPDPGRLQRQRHRHCRHVRSNVNATWNGTTSSSTMLMQRIKEDSARGADSGGGDTKY
jgi:hypothetical protein